MDLKRELLEVLDNPARVWDAVLANLATEPRMSLLVFVTCTTPITLVRWQEAVARVSADAAVRFEASLRVLDDSFVHTYKEDTSPKGDARYYANFRNPSMDDFCADYLDRNVGIAVNIAVHDPAFHQIRRLIQLGTAFAPVQPSRYARPRRHPNIYEALIAHPSVLFNRLFDIMPSDSHMSTEQTRILTAVLTLFSQARTISDRELSVARTRILPLFRELSFNSSRDDFLFSNLDDSSRARMIQKLLGEEFDAFYGAPG